MPLLYYWRKDNYYRDLDFGASFNLNQSNPLLHSIEIGDSLWAFTKNRKNNYVLATHLVIKAKTYNPKNFRYGRYRIWGDLSLSRYFNVENQPNIEHLIRELSCKTNAQILGKAFQGHSAVRILSNRDHKILTAYAKDLEIETRSKLLPEEKLEALLIHGKDKLVYDFIKTIPVGISEKRIEYLYSMAPKRNTELVKELQKIYSGCCQICKWNPVNKYGHSICESHHIHWLSRGGEDKLENLVLICPNHHRAIHRVDAPFDFEKLSFKFTLHEESLRINKHLNF